MIRLVLLMMLLSSHAFSYTIDELEVHMSKNNVSSVEDFVASFNKKFRSRYVLMHTSRSLQGASFQKPRAIMFSEKGDLTFSFNSDSSQKNGDKVEVILFDKEAAKFSAHEIDFASGSPKVHRNPKACVACHGADIRPNWNGYLFWEGAYGSADARLMAKLSNGKEDRREYDELQKFITTYKDHPRYKHLENLEEKTTLVGGNPKPGVFSYDRMKGADLVFFTSLAVNNNVHRFARLMRNEPNYDNFKYTLLAIRSCSFDEAKRALPDNFDLKNLDLKLSRDYDSFYLAKNRDIIYFAFMEALGIDTKFLDTSFNINYNPETVKNISDFISVFSTGGFPDSEFAYAFTRGDEDLMKFVEEVTPGYADYSTKATINCRSLAAKSKRTIKLSRSVVRSQESDLGKIVFTKTCLTCHTRPDITGFSFEGSSLKKALKDDSHLIDKFRYRLDESTPEDERMPFRFKISAEERNAVLEYIEKFAR